MKSIYETLAALGAGAILLGGCAGASQPAASPDVPAATETTPAAAKESGAEGDTAGEATVDVPKTGNEAAMPADSSAPAMSGAPATSAAPAATAAPKKKTGKKAGGPATAGKKKDAAGGCGEGTCG